MSATLFLKKITASIAIASVLVLASSAPVFAHVTIKPGEVATATYQVFTVNVPNEKEVATTAIRLVIPDNVTSVTPTNKQGWQVTTETKQAGETKVVTAITWKDGEISDGLRDEFTFSAKTPERDGEIKWKAYQTYDDGTVVAWDQEESDDNHGHGGDHGPLSITNVSARETSESPVINSAIEETVENAHENADRAFYISIIAVAVSLVAVFFATRKK